VTLSLVSHYLLDSVWCQFSHLNCVCHCGHVHHYGLTVWFNRNPSCEVHQEPLSLTVIDSSLQDTLPQCINTRCSQRFTSRLSTAHNHRPQLQPTGYRYSPQLQPTGYRYSPELQPTATAHRLPLQLTCKSIPLGIFPILLHYNPEFK
jgi:hypothetical protein